MKNSLPIIVAVGVFALLFLVKRRRHRQEHVPTRLERLREGVEGALDDAEQRTAELRDRAKKLRGDAKKRIEEQAHEMEERQKELRGRLEDLKSEATKLVERARS